MPAHAAPGIDLIPSFKKPGKTLPTTQRDAEAEMVQTPITPPIVNQAMKFTLLTAEHGFVSKTPG
jgi:hypothetical protein